MSLCSQPPRNATRYLIPQALANPKTTAGLEKRTPVHWKVGTDLQWMWSSKASRESTASTFHVVSHDTVHYLKISSPMKTKSGTRVNCIMSRTSLVDFHSYGDEVVCGMQFNLIYSPRINAVFTSLISWVPESKVGLDR